MKKQRLFMLFSLLFIFGMSYSADVVVPDGDTIQKYVDAASDGDVLILANGGVYKMDGLKVAKSLTIKAADGYTTRPVVYTEDYINYVGARGVSMTQIGIEFISLGSPYLNRVNKSDSLLFLGMFDCVARGFNRNFIQAKDSPSQLDSVIVEDCYIYAGGGGGYELIYVDDAGLSYLRLSNSSFVTFDESLIYSKNPGVKTIIIENCNIHGRTDASDQSLFKIPTADTGSVFIIKNTIISDIKLSKIWEISPKIVDTIMNVFYHNIEFDSSILANNWSYKANFTETDPMFSNGPAGALYLLAGSPALTASTTGGFIGASRWTVLPPATTLLNLVVNGDATILSPGFNNDVLNYTGDIPFDFGNVITVDALAVFKDVAITGTGQYEWGTSLSLSIDIVVDGSKTFHLDLSRIPPNDDPTLKRIVIRDTADTDYIFFPPDQLGWTEFDLRFPLGNPTMYTIKTDKSFIGTNVSGPDTLDVTSGSGQMIYYCTAESGKSITYTINCATVGTGTVATLRALTLSSATDTFTTTPEFQSGISNYTLDVPASSQTIFIGATSTDSYATITGDESVDISSGSATASLTVTSENGANSKTYTVDITAIVSVKEDLAKNDIRLYHNSNIDQLTIFNTDDVNHLEIFSITGKLLISKSVDYQNTLEISTRSLSDGLYIVQLRNAGNTVKTTKFIK